MLAALNDDDITSALAAGLRAIDVRDLDADCALELTRTGRLAYVTILALTVGSMQPVYVAPELFDRVMTLLEGARGDVVLERVAWFVVGRRGSNA